MASIRVRDGAKRTTYQVVWYNPLVRRQESETFHDRREAHRRLKVIEGQLAAGLTKSMTPSKLTLGDFFGQWMDMDVRRRLTPKVQSQYQRMGERLILPFWKIFGKARYVLAQRALQIATVDEPELIIGDVPVLTFISGSETVGMPGRVGIAPPRVVMLPLGPHTMAILGRGAGRATLAAEEIELANSWQVRNAVERVFFRLGADFDGFIRNVRPPIHDRSRRGA
jgi:hypothetical protein